MTPQAAENLLIDLRMIDIAMLLVGLIVAAAAVWLQWYHFKKSCPPKQASLTRPPFGNESAHNRWRNIYWREVRAMLGFAFISLLMAGGVTIFYTSITVASVALLIFWIGMFFYNLWVAQWYAWRIATKRKR